MLIRSSRASECSYRGIWVPTNRQHFPPSPLIILLSMAGHARSIYLIFVTKGRRGERGHHKSGSRRGPFGAQRMGCGGGGSGAGAQQMSAKVGRLCLSGWFLRRRDGREGRLSRSSPPFAMPRCFCSRQASSSAARKYHHPEPVNAVESSRRA